MNKKIEVIKDVETGEKQVFKWHRIVNFHDGEGHYLKVTLAVDGTIVFWSSTGFSVSPVGGEASEYRLHIKLGR